MARGLARFIALLTALLLIGSSARAEPIKIATVKSTTLGAIYIATEKGYFAAVGIEPQFIDFDSPGLVPPAVVSGSADIGSTGVSAQLYALAGQGAVKIFAGQGREHPGFQINAFILSNAAAAGGLASLDKLAGHSIAISLIGAPVHYAAAQVALRHGVALDTLRFLPLQSNSNIVSAVTGGTADTGVVPATVMAPSLARGELKLLAYVGDEVQWQSSALISAPRFLDAHLDLMKRFLVALRRGLTDYHNAFTAPDGSRRDGPDAAQEIAILVKYVGETPEQIHAAIPWVDPDGRLDFADMKRQLAWFESQNMLKGAVTLDQVIDQRLAEDVTR